jgi:hypothetical protein
MDKYGNPVVGGYGQTHCEANSVLVIFRVERGKIQWLLGNGIRSFLLSRVAEWLGGCRLSAA